MLTKCDLKTTQNEFESLNQGRLMMSQALSNPTILTLTRGEGVEVPICSLVKKIVNYLFPRF